MEAKIINFSKALPSIHGGVFHYAYFKGVDGKSYNSCIYRSCRNFANWESVMAKVVLKEEVWLTGLNLRSDGKVDADSPFKVKEQVSDDRYEPSTEPKSDYESSRARIGEALKNLCV